MNPLVKTPFTKSSKLCSELDLFRFEREIGYKLPADYRKFLIETNGGSFDNSLIFDITKSEKSTQGSIGRFYGFHEHAEASIETMFFAFKIHQKRMIKGMIPIGFAGGGNQIALMLEPNEYGYVYYWFHDWEVDFADEETIADTAYEGVMQNCYLAATSFSEFSDKLRDNPIHFQ